MLQACLETAPWMEQACCLQTPGHPGTHQAYVRDTLIEWDSTPSASDIEGPRPARVEDRAA